jgi:hypothetical protein
MLPLGDNSGEIDDPRAQVNEVSIPDNFTPDG